MIFESLAFSITEGNEMNIRQEQYPNGLVLLAEPIEGVRSAAFTLLTPAGAAFDPSGKLGAATMCAEWVMRGAGQRDSRELLSALDSLGVAHGESAQTYHTGFSAATLGETLISALEIYADVIRRPLLDDEEIEPIRALSQQGLQSLEDDPGSKAMQELRARHFPDPFGRSALGNAEGVAAIAGDDLRAFVRDNYRPNSAILGVAGAIDWERLRDAVARLFGDWETRPEPTVALKPAGPKRDHIVKETQQIQIALAYPAAPVSGADYYQARAAAAILGGYASARLFTEVREKRGLCYSVHAGYESLRDRAAVLCHAGTSTDRAQETLDVTLAEIRRLAREGIDAEELDMMRAGLKSSLVMQQESTMGRSAALAADWFHLGRVRPLEEILSALDALTPESVSEVAARQPLDQMTILTLGPKPLQFPE